jgi:hypothetical protein
LSENGKYILNIPQEVYERVCLPLFGESQEKIELKKVKRQDNPYTEYIYIWFKNKTTLKTNMSGKGIPTNKKLYEQVKKLADETYKKPSAYKSGFIVKKYKELGGTYTDDNNKPLKRWFEEKWQDIGNKDYPVYRPTVRVSKETPLTPEEIDPENLKEQIKLKQEIKGEKNLPKFKSKQHTEEEVNKYSNYEKAKKRLKDYTTKPIKLFLSDRKDKKYFIIHPTTAKPVYFGQMGYEDFLKHGDEARRQHYLKRATNIKGDWKADKFSPNNLAINILW